MGKFTIIIVALIFAVTAVASLYVVIPRVDRFLNILAVQACSSSAHVTSSDGSHNTAQYPIQDLYQKCLDQTK